MTVDESRIDALLDQMTLEEQVALLAGASTWTTPPVERLGIPAIKVSDGPNGARGGGALIGGVPAACFPVGIALAATWNTALVEQVGQALGEEALTKGARVLLAPTVNIHRTPLNGRNFECYSEDPHLSARMAVAYITGVQSKGVAATVKHFIANDSEFERNTISSEVDERTLREIYLPPFEAAVKEAGTWALMSSYNRVNGAYVNDRPDLINELLKGEWGFDGVVMSDWSATHSTAAAMNGGLDLEMPGPTQFRGQKLVDAVRAGEVPAEAVREGARRMLRLIARVGAFDDPAIPEEQAIDRPEHRAVARRAAAEAIVLLKNDGLLPLAPAQLEKVAVIGPNAKTAQIMGGGSAQVNAHYRVTPFEGVAAAMGDQVELSHAEGCTNHKLLPLLGLSGGFSVEYFNGLELAGQPAHTATIPLAEQMWFAPVPGVDMMRFGARLRGSYTPAVSGAHQLSLVSAGLSRLLLDGQLLIDNWEGRNPGEHYFGFGSAETIASVELQAGQTYELVVEYARGDGPPFSALRVGHLPPQDPQAIERAVALAAEADVAIVCVGLTGEWETEGHDRKTLALAGRQDELVARVAAANPRTVVVLQTGSPVTMPWLNDVAAVIQAWFPGQECGNAIADVLTGAYNPSGRLPQTFPARLEDHPAIFNYPGENGRVRYGEGIFVGYRAYERRRLAPLFPFGFGLSYTSFAWGGPRLSAATIGPDEELTVTVEVTNTGERAGQEVVQLYVRPGQAQVARPEQELKGFAKVELAPGETKTVELRLGWRDMAYFDDRRHAWVADAGSYEVRVGASSQAIHGSASFTLSAERAEPTRAGLLAAL
jgi:beta-glucosidase